jgi:hypothetical protein
MAEASDYILFMNIKIKVPRFPKPKEPPPPKEEQDKAAQWANSPGLQSPK